jgi:hypothetical protein
MPPFVWAEGKKSARNSFRGFFCLSKLFIEFSYMCLN